MWMEHMYLQEDGCSDPPGIRVRPCTGLNAVNYLDPGTFVKVGFYFFYFRELAIHHLNRMRLMYLARLLIIFYLWDMIILI